jgi:formamidopyrimidine-DNA glycosylase
LPELPDVEIFRQYFNATALHQTIAEVVECQGDLLCGTAFKSLKKHLVGEQFASASRHGKNLFSELTGGGFLVLHFGMTGFL